MRKFLLILLLVISFLFTPGVSSIVRAASIVDPNQNTLQNSSSNSTSNTGQNGPGSPWYNPSFFDFYDKVYNENTSPQSEIFGERYTAAQTTWVFFSVISGALNLPYTILGFFGIEVQSPTPTVCVLGVVHGTIDIGACVDSIGNVMDAFLSRITYIPANNQPIQNMWADVFSNRRDLSLINYVSKIGRGLSLTPVVHAQEQGFGFQRLLVISDMWKVTRNAAYSVFIIALIAISFMVMFRIKISPQAVVTIQSAIPKIAITLITITFSLAIAGLMVDIMYVMIGLISTFLAGVSGLAGNSPLEVYNFFVGGRDALLNIFVYFLIYFIAYIVTAFVVTVSAIGTLNLTTIVFGVLMLIFTLILFFILLVNWFKVIYVLIKTTAQIYLTVITGPLQLMMGVFPGQMGENAFSGWLKALASKLAVYPVVGVLLFFAFKFLGISFHLAIKGWSFAVVGTAVEALGGKLINVCTGIGIFENLCNYFYGDIADAAFWGPPLLGNAGAITGLIFLFLSVGAIMAIGKVPDMIEAFMAGKSLGPSGIGEALGPFARPLQGIMGVGTDHGTAATQAWLLNQKFITELEARLKASGRVGNAVGGLIANQRKGAEAKIS